MAKAGRFFSWKLLVGLIVLMCAVLGFIDHQEKVRRAEQEARVAAEAAASRAAAQPEEDPLKDAQAKHRAVVNEYGQRHVHIPEAYWLKTAMVDTQQKAVEDWFRDRLSEQGMGVSMVIGRSAKLSPLAGQIDEVSRTLLPTVCLPNNQSFFVKMPDAPAVADPAALEVCFIPSDQLGPEDSPLHFSQERNSVMIAAINWPPVVMAGIVMHEFGHALRFRQHAASATAPKDSDEYCLEEIEMHELETLVLDSQTGGRYTAWLDEVLLRTPHPREVREVVYGITAEDLRLLDVLMGSQGAGIRVGNAVLSQAVTALGLRAIDRSFAGDRKMKIEFYKRVSARKPL